MAKPTVVAQLDIQNRVGVSTISFRHRSLDDSLRIISGLGAVDVDLGAIPAVVDHVPIPLRDNPDRFVEALTQHDLRAGAVNADVGDLNDPDLEEQTLINTVYPLAKLSAAVGGSLIVPAGRASWEPFINDTEDLNTLTKNLRLVSRLCSDNGVRLHVELLHHLRYVHSVTRAERVLHALDAGVFGLLFDVSHIVASEEDPAAWLQTCAERVERVHLRDAVPGNFNLGIGRGQVDFGAVISSLEAQGFNGSYILELETHDVAEDEREADTARSRQEIISTLQRHHRTITDLQKGPKV